MDAVGGRVGCKKNIPNDRLIEDPFFKASHQSYFLQAADFIAFALLKAEVPPTAAACYESGLNRAYGRPRADLRQGGLAQGPAGSSDSADVTGKADAPADDRGAWERDRIPAADGWSSPAHTT